MKLLHHSYSTNGGLALPGDMKNKEVPDGTPSS